MQLISCLRACPTAEGNCCDALQKSDAAFERAVPARTRHITGADRAAKTRYRLLSDHEADPPETWSKAKAFYRTGISPNADYVANEWGGALQATQLYNQDHARTSCSGESRCKNGHPSRKQLGPGVMVRCRVRSSDCCHVCAWRQDSQHTTACHTLMRCLARSNIDPTEPLLVTCLERTRR